jgi:hypothetical protein
MIINTVLSEEDRLAFQESYLKHDFSAISQAFADKIDRDFLKQYMDQQLQKDMQAFYDAFKTKDWPVVKKAKVIAAKQLEFYDEMMHRIYPVPNRKPRGID